MTQNKAIELFDSMYSSRTIRDTIYHIISCYESGETVLDANALQAFQRMAREYNRESNEAMLQMVDGWYTFRDDTGHYQPVLMHMGDLVAVWHDFGDVEIVTE